MLAISSIANAQRILFHGADVDATFGHDGDILAHLQSIYGPNNVSYMQGDMAAADGSSADGFDAVIISATLNSGTVRNKYEDIPIGLMNWEQALTRQAAGEFNLSNGGRTFDGLTDIIITDESHPIAAGIPAGPVTVFNSPQTMSFGTGALGSGVTRIAAGTPDENNDHAILAADVGDALLGDGSPENPATAPGRRVMFFLQDNGFPELTPEGMQLFNNAVSFVVGEELPDPGDFNGDGVIDGADYDILVNNLGGHLDGPVGRSEGDLVIDGKIDLDDFGAFKELFPGALGQAAAIPEPSSLAIAAAMIVAIGAARCRGQVNARGSRHARDGFKQPN